MLPLRLLSEFTRIGPSRFATEAVLGAVLEWPPGQPVPDAQALMRCVSPLSPLLDWLPDVPPAPTGLQTLGSALARLTRYLLNMHRGMVETAACVALGPERVLMLVGLHEPAVARRGLRLAHALLEAAHQPPEPREQAALADAVARFAEDCHRAHPDFINRVLQLGARQRDVPVLRAPAARAWQFGWGLHGRLFREAGSDGDGQLGAAIARDKVQTTEFLRGLGLPHTRQLAALSLEQARAHAAALGNDLVVKPLDSGQGRGVTVGVRDAAALDRAYAEAARYSRTVVVEQRVEGADYRLLVVDGRLLAAARREPPAVVGDGQSTIARLVQALNERRRNDAVMRRYLKQLKLDATVVQHLAGQGLDPAVVPAPGQRVTLRGNANVSTGGTAHDVLPLVHPHVRAMGEAIARALGLRACGIDYLTPDISRPWGEVGGAVIEVNTMPGLDVHVASGCDEVELGAAVLGRGPARIPVAVVVATPATLEPLAAALAAEVSRLPMGGVAVTLPGHFALDGVAYLAAADLHGRAAQALLHREARVAVLGGLPEELAAQGFPVDRCDLALVEAPALAGPAGHEVQQLLSHRNVARRVERPADAAQALQMLADFLRQARDLTEKGTGLASL